MVRDDLEEQVAALDEARAYLDVEGWVATEIRGSDAERWLNDLVTASVEDLEPGGSVRSMLLSPTGRIRADFLVYRTPPDAPAFLLVQSPDQPDRLEDLLGPYVLSSDVVIARASSDGLVVFPAGGGGLAAAESPPPASWRGVGWPAYERWRIRRGIPRFPVDVDTDSSPAEANLDREPLIDRGKGCYLGQESVARIRNLGHPARVVLTVRSEGPVTPGAPVLSEQVRVGNVTSAERSEDSPASAIVRIRWDARDQELLTEGGTRLVPR